MRDTQETIIPELFSAIIALISGVMAYLARLGFVNDGLLISKSILISFLLIFSPYAIKMILSKRWSKEWYFTDAFIILVCLAILVLAGRLCHALEINGSYMFALLGGGFFIAAVIDKNGISRLRLNVPIFIIFIIFSVWVASVYWGHIQFSPLGKEKIITGAWPHRDMLMHASIAAMFNTYGIFCTGLDGLVPFPYHIMSHYVYGAMSALLCIDTVTFYNIAAPIIFIPLFFHCFILCVRATNSYYSTRLQVEKVNESDIRYWILLFILFVHPIPFNIIGIYGGETYQYLISTSYAFALTLTFILISIFFSVVDTFQRRGQLDVSKNTIIYFALFVPLLYLIISVTKFSFLYLIGISLGYLFIRLKLYRNMLLNLTAAGCICVVIFVYAFFIAPIRVDAPTLNYSAHIGLAEYYNSEIIGYFFFIYPSLIYIGLRIHFMKLKSLTAFKQHYKNLDLLDIELLLILLIVSFVPPYPYFKGFQIYVACILILSNYRLFLGESPRVLSRGTLGTA